MPNLIEPDVVNLLERTLNDASSPLGCTQQLTSPVKFRSFWQTLDLIVETQPKLSQSDQSALRDLVQSCKQDITGLRLLSSTTPSPILAVCGLLNSGKSSLVAGFLSDRGRQRVLVGLGDDAGTHRFVIWLPESWKANTALWNAAIDQIGQVFGQPPQILSDDPAVARRQYNGLLDKAESDSGGATAPDGQTFAEPLIATDPMLDELGVGLMDCPDIQSGIFGPSNDLPSVENGATFRAFQDVADQRARTLLKSLRIASGLIVVAQSNLIRERTLQQLLECAHVEMPRTRLFVAVNRVPKRYSPDEIKSEVNRHYRKYQPHGIYMAYDFRGPDANSHVPDTPRQWKSENRTTLPIFFDIDAPNTREIGKPLPPEDYLVSIGSRLDANQLASELVGSTIERVVANLKHCEHSIQSAVSSGQKRLKRLHVAFSEAILQFTAVQGEGSNVRLQLSQEIIDQVRQSLERTAPWWAKPSQSISRWSTSVGTSAKGLTKKIPGLPSVGKKVNESVEWIRGKIRSGQSGSVMTASQLATSLRRSDHAGDLPASGSQTDDSVVAASNNIIVRFQSESHARLNDTALDGATALLWKNMPLKQKLYTGVAPATLIFAPLIAVVTIPLDFGTTHVLVFATVKELLLAGVASAGIFLLQSDQFPELAESQAAWQQVSDLFAITCDEFGCARPQSVNLPYVQIGRETRQILKSDIKTASLSSNCLIPILEYQSGFRDRFYAVLGELKPPQRPPLS